MDQKHRVRVRKLRARYKQENFGHFEELSVIQAGLFSVIVVTGI